MILLCVRWRFCFLLLCTAVFGIFPAAALTQQISYAKVRATKAPKLPHYTKILFFRKTVDIVLTYIPRQHFEDMSCCHITSYLQEARP